MYKQLLLLISIISFSSFSYATAITADKPLPAGPSSDLEFVKPWARPSMSASNNSAAYFTIKNNSDKEYILIGASAADTANNVELHQSFVDEKGVSKMTNVDKMVIPSRAEVVLKPGGNHIMLFDLKRNLKTGDKFKLELKFDKSDPKTIEVEVSSQQ